MNILIMRDYNEISRQAALLVAASIALKPNLVLGLPTGRTPIRMYKELVVIYKNGFVNFSDVVTFNIDEYIGLPRENPNSFYSYMHNNFFRHINIKKENIHIPNGMAKDIKKECVRYENLIRKKGPIDLMILGIGYNGHIGFNEPSDEFIPETHVEVLTERTRMANSRYFGSLAKVPSEAITMGLGTIMHSKKIILLASGRDKAETILRAVKGNITPRFPASILRLHRDCTFILDRDAAGLIKKK
ncbi:MAG: glucosamine-6-phosphate deaminase [Deltaproteobacteria bacterium]|nr:glucosamine-6-phosphate deaminase [Deltaproteobacteria bacterium]